MLGNDPILEQFMDFGEYENHQGIKNKQRRWGCGAKGTLLHWRWECKLVQPQ